MTIIDYNYDNLTMIVDQLDKKNSIVCTLYYVNDT